jgi:phenylalanyl-tRNA synthetase beta chain
VREVTAEAHLPQRSSVRLRRERIPRLLGVAIEDRSVEDILSRLGMELRGTDDGWDVTPPSARFDITIEVDLIEEIGRIYGYANIPEDLSAAPVSVIERPEGRFGLDRAKLLLLDRDYQEAVTYSFISPEMAQRVTPQWPPIRLANPISADMAVMRASLWPGLLSTLQHNLARQQERVRLFESGLRFRRVDGELVQDNGLAGLIYGPNVPEQWAMPSRPVDFYDLKADVEALLGLAFDLGRLAFEPVEDPALHPGQSARVLSDGRELGRLGLLHPALQSQLEIPKNVFVFEIDLAALPEAPIPAFEPISKFPAIRRDLALLVDRSVAFATLYDTAKRAAPGIVQSISVFDVYTGENIDSGLKSIALSLILQESSHTLTDEEVDRAETAILSTLAAELGARRRE